MSETTTTPKAVADAGDAIVLDDEPTKSQPDEAVVPAAEATTEETHTDPKGTDESEAAKAEADRRYEWLKNKGIDPTDPDALDKVEAKWREAEQGFHRDNQSKPKQSVQDAINQDDTVTAITDEQGLDPTVVQLQRDMKELKFFGDHPEAKDRQDQIIATAKKYPKLAADFDLETLYAIAKSENLDDTVTAAKSQGRQEAKAEIAKSSVAAAPAGMASGPTDTPKKDAFEQGFNQE